MACSIKLFSAKKLKLEFIRLDVNIFNITDSKAMGRKFHGTFVTLSYTQIQYMLFSMLMEQYQKTRQQRSVELDKIVRKDSA